MASSSKTSHGNNSDLYPTIFHCPPILKRTMNPSQSKAIQYAAWEKETEHIFDGQWKETPWRIENLTVKIRWGPDKRRTQAWENYDHIARISDGKPFLQCQRCQLTLAHPSLRSIGTSTLNRHIETEQCKETAKRRGYKPLDGYFKKKEKGRPLHSRYNASI